MAVSYISTYQQQPTVFRAQTMQNRVVKSLDGIFSFALVLSILLGSIRIGLSDAYRPTVLITLPCLLYLMVMNGKLLGRIVRSRFGICNMLLFLILALGHLLGHDVVPGVEVSGAELSWENLIIIPLTLFCGIIISEKEEYKRGMIAGLITGLTIHVVCLAILPPVILYRAYGRMSGLLSDPNIILLHIIPVYFLWLGTVHWRKFLIVMPLVALPVIWATFQTLSRTGLFSLIIGLVITFLGAIMLLVKMRRWLPLVGLLCFFPVCLGGLYIAMPDYFNTRMVAFIDRLEHPYYKNRSIVEDRLYWYRLMERTTVYDHVLNPLGMGYGLYLKGNSLLPHNTFIDAYIVGGPIALLLICVIYLEFSYRFLCRIRKRFSDIGLTMTSVVLLAFMVTQILILATLSVFTLKVNWVLLGIAIGLYSFPVIEQRQHFPMEPLERR